MARLQILELPEGSSDDRPPFVLVIDESSYPTIEAYQAAEGWWQQLAQQIGAQGCIVTSDTVDIPANDTSAYSEAVVGALPPDARYEVTIGGKPADWTRTVDAVTRQTPQGPRPDKIVGRDTECSPEE